MIDEILVKLLDYAKCSDYKGWDPYDGLNSLLFRKSPLYQSGFFRLCWIQLFKRNPINLRAFLFVPKERNPKGIALFASSLLNLYKATQDSAYSDEAVKLLSWLEENYSEGYSGHAWGYNFPWQSRYDLKEKYFPTIVTTSFVGETFLDAFETTNNQKYLDIAASSSKFILKDLNIHKEKDEIAFSYGPDDNSKVYNATALGAQLLARLYYYTKNPELANFAEKGMNFLANKQNSDGSWHYGDLKTQKWIDSFHTGYNLTALKKYMEYTGDDKYRKVLNNGFAYYEKALFNSKGEPKYFSHSFYPVDIHVCAYAILMFNEFEKKNRAEEILTWTVKKLYNKKGYFDYQITKMYRNSIPYMRWGQAWIFAALSKHFLNNG